MLQINGITLILFILMSCKPPNKSDSSVAGNGPDKCEDAKARVASFSERIDRRERFMSECKRANNDEKTCTGRLETVLVNPYPGLEKAKDDVSRYCKKEVQNKRVNFLQMREGCYVFVGKTSYLKGKSKAYLGDGKTRIPFYFLRSGGHSGGDKVVPKAGASRCLDLDTSYNQLFFPNGTIEEPKPEDKRLCFSFKCGNLRRVEVSR